MNKQNKKYLKDKNHIDVFLLTSKEPSDFVKGCLKSLRVYVTNYNNISNPAIIDTYVKEIKNCQVIIYFDDKFYGCYDNYLLGVAMLLNKPVIHMKDIYESPAKKSLPINDYVINKLGKDCNAEFEIEKKYLVSSETFNNFITNLNIDHIYNINQFFDKNGVRYRKTKEGKNNIYQKTIKSDTNFGKTCRFEIECKITKKEYEDKRKEFNSMKLYKRSISKTRWVHEYYDEQYKQPLKFEFNKIKIGSRFLYMIEVEVPELNLLMKVPDLFKKLINCENKEIVDVTEDSLITNKKLMLLDIKDNKHFLSYIDYINFLCPNSFVKPVKEKKKK